MLQAPGPTTTVLLMLAELLDRAGDLTAARERYYAVIEVDAEHLRVRTRLGCVLAERDDRQLALAALDGVLRHEPRHAETHWYAAGVLADLGRPREARQRLDALPKGRHPRSSGVSTLSEERGPCDSRGPVTHRRRAIRHRTP